MEEEKKEEIKQEIEAPVTPVVPTPQEEKPKKNVLVFIIISLVVLIGVGVLLIVLLTGNKEEDKPKDNEQKEEEKKEEEKPAETKYTLNVYQHADYDDICIEETAGCSRVKYVIDTETSDAKVLDASNYGLFILYKDNGIKIYDAKEKSSKKINIENNYKKYYLVTDIESTKVYGISYTTQDDYCEYYNISLGKKMYQNRFKNKEDNSFYLVNEKYIGIVNNETAYLLNINEEKVALTDKSEYDLSSYRSIGEKGSYIYELERCAADCGMEKLYTSDLKLLCEENDDEPFEYSVDNNIVYIGANNTIKQYDFNGKLLSTSKEYNKIIQIDNGYVVYVNNNKYIIENIDNPTESKEIAPYDIDKAYYSFYDSGYYTRKQLDLMDEKDKKEGFYIVIVYTEQDKNTGYYGMEYCYTPSKEIVTFPIKQEVGGRAKPVLYLYPTVDTKVEVKLSHPEYLSTTYPKYNNGWKVFAKPNGDLYDLDGKYYYALYWDEVRYAEVDFSTGFYVESKDAIKFLEEKLTYIGLNDKERNEFIMYWLPILEKNGKSLVYFELTEEREANNKLLITPTPDSLLRVNIHIKKVNSKVDIKEQKLTSFNRHGFTAVEWGGMTY